jgi:hypothetical protein
MIFGGRHEIVRYSRVRTFADCFRLSAAAWYVFGFSTPRTEPMRLLTSL